MSKKTWRSEDTGVFSFKVLLAQARRLHLLTVVTLRACSCRLLRGRTHCLRSGRFALAHDFRSIAESGLTQALKQRAAQKNFIGNDLESSDFGAELSSGFHLQEAQSRKNNFEPSANEIQMQGPWLPQIFIADLCARPSLTRRRRSANPSSGP
jgi:hypothetical protein